MKKLSLGFADTYDNAKNFFTDVLSKRYDITINNHNPDYLIFGDRNFGFSHLNGNYVSSKKIFFTGENVRPYWSECQYAISFDHENSSRHYRLPLWVLELWAVVKDNNPSGAYKFDTLLTMDRTKNYDKKTFGVAFIQSNPNNTARNLIINDIKHMGLLYSAGPLFNTMGYTIPRDRLLKFDFFSQYVFGSAIENGSHPGYVTEKLIDCYYSSTIPLYWGSSTVGRDFNLDSMVVLNGMDDYESLKAKLEVYRDPEKVREKLAQPVFNNNVLPDVAYIDNFLDWFERWVY